MAHQTLLVIDGSTTPAFKERVERLLQSVNGSNIKVDVQKLDASPAYITLAQQAVGKAVDGGRNMLLIAIDPKQAYDHVSVPVKTVPNTIALNLAKQLVAALEG